MEFLETVVTTTSGLCAQLDIKGVDIGPTKNQEVDSYSRNSTLIGVTGYNDLKYSCVHPKPLIGPFML